VVSDTDTPPPLLLSRQNIGFDTLLTTDITKSSAMQRAGRAGREGHGYCFRLYTEDAFKSMIPSTEPEVLRSSLTSVYLQLKVIGQDLDTMPFMDRPDQESGVFSRINMKPA
jgi:ATP-dependent RNA helicase DHX33